MAKFIIRRILQTIPLLIAITLMVFVLIDAMPGNELTAYLNTIEDESRRPSQQQLEQMTEQLGLNRPWHIRYLNWMQSALKGDFGTSLEYRRPASEIVGTLIWRTFMLNGVAAFMIFLLGIPIGVRSAANKDSLFDKFFSTGTLVVISIPSFVIGIYLIRLLAVNISWIPPTGMRSVIMLAKGYPSKGAEILDVMNHMILPVMTLTLVGLGNVVRYVRNAVLDVIHQDYVRTARSKGLKERIVIYRHAFKNAWIPIISLLGTMIPGLFVGNIFVEAIFVWPGIGLEFLYAVYRRDTALISVIILFFSFASVIGNLLADILYGVADPRVKTQ